MLGILVVGSFNFAGCKKEEKVIKIGAILPLTGKIAFLGEGERKGFDFAKRKLKEEGIDQIQVIYEDSKGESKTAVTVANKLLNQDKVQILITSLTSVSYSVQPLIEKKKDVLQFVVSTDPFIASRAANTFRLYYGLKDEAQVMVKFIKQYRIKSVGIFYLNIEAYKHEYEKILIPQIKEIVKVEETYDFETKDYKSLLVKFKSADVELLIIAGFPHHLGNILKAIREITLKPKYILANLGFVVGDLGVDPSVYEGVLFCAPYYLFLKDTSTIKFKQEYRKIIGEDPGYEAANAYDLLYTVLGLSLIHI